VSAQRIEEELRQKLAVVDLGLAAQQFLSTPLGKYVHDRAIAEVETGVEDLKRVDPTDARAVMKLQGEIWRAESFMYWMADAIREGAELATQLIAEERAGLGAGLDHHGGDATGN
jgi:hypothetical protein